MKNWSPRTGRVIAAVAGLLLLTVGLSSCARLQWEAKIKANETVNHSFVMALDTAYVNEVAKEEGVNFEAAVALVRKELTGDMPKQSLFSNVDVKDYEADGYYGIAIRNKRASPLEDMNGSVGPWSLNIVKVGGEFRLTGQIDLESGDLGAALRTSPEVSDQADIQLRFTFPGKVKSATGVVSGRTVIFRPAVGQVTELNAVASATPDLMMVAIGGGLVVLLAAGFLLFRTLRRPASPLPDAVSTPIPSSAVPARPAWAGASGGSGPGAAWGSGLGGGSAGVADPDLPPLSRAVPGPRREIPDLGVPVQAPLGQTFSPEPPAGLAADQPAPLRAAAGPPAQPVAGPMAPPNLQPAPGLAAPAPAPVPSFTPKPPHLRSVAGAPAPSAGSRLAPPAVQPAAKAASPVPAAVQPAAKLAAPLPAAIPSFTPRPPRLRSVAGAPAPSAEPQEQPADGRPVPRPSGPAPIQAVPDPPAVSPAPARSLATRPSAIPLVAQPPPAPLGDAAPASGEPDALPGLAVPPPSAAASGAAPAFGNPLGMPGPVGVPAWSVPAPPARDLRAPVPAGPPGLSAPAPRPEVSRQPPPAPLNGAAAGPAASPPAQLPPTLFATLASTQGPATASASPPAGAPPAKLPPDRLAYQTGNWAEPEA
ncbi:MAG: hypothetical protein LBL01_00930 [Bifidobacteriaceae bacterium]|jgi:hypothetical protein|nr:hypothetical protein [Bifidobacteriaceae bacterium]